MEIENSLASRNSQPKPGPSEIPFVFRGTASEYFGIWIVNILLTIITFGIYSAWAKVRRNRYFYGNTFLDGHAFDYHARPVQILKGRLIAIAAIVAWNVLAGINPIAALPILLAYLAALPWIIIVGLRFNARMTSYRNVRFKFTGRYWRALVVFILMPIGAIFSLGLLLPVSTRMTARYLAGGYSYGTADFAANPRLGGYYNGFVVAAAVFFGFAIVAGIAAGLVAIAASQGALPDDGSGMPGFATIAVVAFYAALVPAAIYYRTVSRNVSYNALVLDEEHRFRSTMSPLRYVWILVSNAVVTVATIGLMRPWAAIRSSRYVVAHTTLLPAGPLDAFSDRIGSDEGVAAGEYLDLGGIDIGF